MTNYLNKTSGQHFEEAARESHFLEDTILSFEEIIGAVAQSPIDGLGGIFRNDDSFVKSSSLYDGLAVPATPPLSNTIKGIEGTYIYLGWISDCWGHVFTDGFKKLWFFQTQKCKELLIQGAKIVYISHKNKCPHNNIYKLFSIIGIDLNQCIMITENSRFERLIMPDDCFIGGFDKTSYTKEYAKLISILKDNSKRMLENCKSDKYPVYNKIYFTRTGIRGGKNRDYGEKGIERFFKKLGYKIISPEKHTLEEQIWMLSHCESFASTEGSVGHNSIFCNSEAEVVILRKCNAINRYQFIINEIIGFCVTYIDAHRSVNLWEGSEFYGPFFLDINDNLRKWANKFVFVIYRPYWSRYKWWYRLLFNRKIFKRFESTLLRIGIDINPY